MKHILPAIVTIPAILVSAIAVFGSLTGQYLFQELGVPAVLLILPIVSFTTCVALSLVFPNAKEWKIAAVINAIPLLLVILILMLFALVGYHG